MSPLKVAFAAIFTSLIMTNFFLNTYFAYPDRGDADSCNLCIFRTIVYMGVFIVGILGIQYNGRMFIDDSSRTV